MKSRNLPGLLRITGVLMALLLPAGLTLKARAQAPSYNYFPSGAENDGRFLSLAGIGNQTLAGDNISIAFQAPPGTAQFEVGIFDGDTGQTSPNVAMAGTSAHWDSGAVPLEYSLYADPRGDATGRYLIGRWMGNGGNGTIAGGMNTAPMPDNGWFNIPVVTSPESRNPNGNYYYVLKVRNPQPTVNTISSFKVRSDANISILAQAISIYGPFFQTSGDENLILNPPGQPSNYDGTWDVNLNVPTDTTFLEVWDGDLDYGNISGTTVDTDDPDTDNTGIPLWGVGTAAIPEGHKGMGSPADDTSNPFQLRTPNIMYEVQRLADANGPAGPVFSNNNPSGNLEWERFLIDSRPGAVAGVNCDYVVPGLLPRGTYRMRILGMDLRNLDALRFFHDAVGVGPDGDPIVKIPASPVAVIGDYVWLDTDKDNTPDAGEAPVSGVKMEVLDANGAVYQVVYTNLDGFYYCPVDPNATYTVRVAASNFAPGGPLFGLSSTQNTNVLTRSVGTEDVLTYDFGYAAEVRNSSLGDTVWLDSNGNGGQDSGEAGIANVTVQLLDSAGAVLGSQVTDADGKYLYTQLTAGTYSTQVVASTLPAGLVQTADYDGLGTPHKASAALGDNETNLNLDFGYKPAPAKLGDRVWYDANANGIQDSGENGVSGVTVNLINNGGTVATTTTDASGSYLFDNLAAGNYSVQFVAPAGYAFTTANAGGDDSVDSDADAAGQTASVSLAAGEANLTLDAGIYLLGSLGDTVWFDLNGSGLQDSGEPGIPGVTIRLYNGSGALVATATTGASGDYLFTDLGPGAYTATVDPGTLPAGLVQTYDLDGTGTAHTAGASLSTGQNRTDVDFGYKPAPAQIGDRVWLDTDKDGVQDAGEAGVAGVTVTLHNATGAEIATTTTDASGNYLFSNLEPGTYSVEFSLPSGKQFTTANVGDDLSDSDANATTGTTSSVTVAAGESNLSLDAGIFNIENTDPRPFRTQTQGGWGTKPNGSNPGAFLAANFSAVFPNGLTVGTGKTLKLTTAQAVEVFLPQGGTAGVFTTNYINPKSTSAGVLAGQLTAATISQAFSAAGKTRSGLGSLKAQTGSFAGYTVDQILSIGHAVIGGNLGALPAGKSISNLNDALTAINENFCDGNQDHGFLR